MAKTFLIVSGKGGVGKSTLAAALGLNLARAGYATVLVDADLGLRSLDSLLGLENQVVFDLVDAASRACDLEDALLSLPGVPGLRLLPAAQFARVRDLDRKRFRRILGKIQEAADYILIDCPAGLEKGLRNMLACAEGAEAILIATPDDLCIRDAERTAQVLRDKGMDYPRLVINRLRNDLIRSGEMLPAAVIAAGLDLPLLGEIPEDETVYRAQLRHARITDFDCPAAEALSRISKRLTGKDIPLPEFGRQKPALWERLFPRRLKEVPPLDRH